MLDFDNVFGKIWNDRTSGSAELLKKYIDLLIKYLDQQMNYAEMLMHREDLHGHHTGKSSKYKIIDRNKFKKSLMRSRDYHKSFLVIQHFLNELIVFLDSYRPDPEYPCWIKALSEMIKEYDTKWNNINERIAQSAGTVIDIKNKTILVHSNSSTIKSFFSVRDADSSNTRIIQTESRPLLEGRIQAGYLAGIGYDVKLIADSAVGRYAGIAGMAVLGADAIYKEFFINKCGSLPITLICREHGIPVYVLADSRKIWPLQESTGPDEEIKPPDELWEKPPDNVMVENYYFERIPNNLVTLFITETTFYPGKEI